MPIASSAQVGPTQTSGGAKAHLGQTHQFLSSTHTGAHAQMMGPSGNRIFASLRGSVPLTGDPHVAMGSTPPTLSYNAALVLQALELGVRIVVALTMVDEAGPTQPQRLHLGAREHHARLVGVLDVVVVARLLVLRDHLLALLLRHPTILSGGPSEVHGGFGAGSQSQFIGSTARPLAITVKCRWQPVDQPVLPSKPMTWPSATRAPTPTL